MCGLQHQRNQVRLGLVAFTQFALGVGAGRVEIAQAHRLQPVSMVIVGQGLLHHQLAAAVGVDGLSGVRLVDALALRLAKDCRRGREDEALHVGRQHRIQQRQRVCDVVAVVLGRLRHRFTHLDERCKVHHCIKAVPGEQLAQQGAVTHIALYQFTVQHRIAVAAAQVVQGGHPATLSRQVLDHVGADVTGSADDEDMHGIHMGLSKMTDVCVFIPRREWIARLHGPA